MDSATGQPVGQDTTEGVPVVARITPQGGCSLRSRSRGSTRWHAPFGAHATQAAAPVLEPARRCSRGRRRTPEIGTYTVKAPPADEAQGVRHARRREALPSNRYEEGSRSMRKHRRVRVSRARVGRSWPVRTARPSCPSPSRANGRGRNGTLTPSRTISGDAMCTQDDAPGRFASSILNHRRRATTRPTQTS